MNRDYQKDAHINPEDLEGEWLEQPSLYLYYAEAHANALHDKDLAKSLLDLQFAKMYSKIKKQWDKYFDDKPTETAIKEYICSHPAYRKLELEFIDAVRASNIMLAAKTAMDHRKKALENLVHLRISGHNAEPRIKRNRKPESKEVHTAQKRSLNESGARAMSRLSRKRSKRNTEK